MKRVILRASFFIFLFVALLYNVYAALPDSLRKAPLNISLIPPLNVYGPGSASYQYNVSINVLAGYDGGLKGFQIGGIYNGLRKDMAGFQIAGMVNAVGNRVTGFQVGGIGNTGRYVKGSQIGGLFNIASNDFQGLQIAGLFNAAGTDPKQQPLELNTQIAGLFNFAGKLDHFVQIAGIYSGARQVKSTQISGLWNRSQSVEGVQIGGVLNENKGDINGIQISGVINHSRKVTGGQIGFINIADSVDGYMIGAVNISRKNGRRSWDIGISDALFANIRFVSGVNDLYNFLSIGASYTDALYAAYGIGIGYDFGRSLNRNFFSEFSWNQVTERNSADRIYFNSLFSFANGIEWKTSDTHAFRIAPVLNLYISKTRDYKSKPVRETTFPIYGHKIRGNASDLTAWAGLQLSYRFFSGN